MKSLFIAALVLCGSFAYATPNVGDMASYDVTISNGTTVVNQNVMRKLIAYDAVAKAYASQTTIKPTTGEARVSTVAVTEDSILGDAFMTNIIPKCVSDMDGVVESVTTGKGTMQACKLTVANANATGFQWVGAVPFGVIKTDVTMTASKNHLVVKLVDYTFGK